MKKKPKASLTQKAVQALRDAVGKVVEDHRQRRKPLAVWRDGQAVWIAADEIEALHEKPAPYRTRSDRGKSR